MEYKLKFENGRSCEIYCESDGKPLQDKINAAEERFGSKVKTINGKEVTEHGLGGFLVGAIIGGLAGNSVSKQGVKKTIKSVGTEAKKVVKKTTTIAKKAVDAVKKKEAPKSKKSNYVPNRLIDSIETKSGKKIDNKDIIDGAHTKKKILVSKKRVASTPKDIDKEKALKLQSDYLSAREIKVVNTTYGRKIKGSEIIDGAYVKKGVFADGGSIEGFNWKSFTISELIEVLPEDVQFLYFQRPDKKEYINYSDVLKDKSLLNTTWTISDSGDMSLSKGSENLYLDIVVYDQATRSEQENKISIYTKDNHSGLKKFASSLIEKFKSGGKTKDKYEGDIVEIRPASKKSNKFIIWSVKNDMIWANEKFDSVSEAKEFIEQNKLVLKDSSIFEGGGKTDYRYEYMLLDRLRQDNDYFLGFGARNPNRLWAGNVDEQIAEMKKLYNSLPEKPEWITMEDIEEYERKMKTEEMAKGGVIGDSGTITDTKSMYQGKMGFIEMDMGNEWIVKVLDNGKEKSVTVRKSGFKILEDEEFGDGGKTSKEYKIFEGFDHLKKKNVYRVIGVENDYVGEWHNTREEAQSEIDSMSQKFASGGIVGKDVTFNHWSGDIRKGIITEQLEDGQYAVSSGYGSVLVSPDDIISTSERVPQKKFLGIFEKGGIANDKKKYAKGGSITFSEDDQEGFDYWIEDGNARKNADGTYSTQDAQYRNKLTLDELKRYFVKEYLPDSDYLNPRVESNLLTDEENDTLNEELESFEDLIDYKDINTFSSGGNMNHTMILLDNGHILTINWDSKDVQYSLETYPSIEQYAFSEDGESGWDNEYYTENSESRMSNLNDESLYSFLYRLVD